MGEMYKPVPEVEALRYKGTPEKPDIKIFVSHRIDLDSETVDDPVYIPVRCGAVYDKRENITMLGDDTGENISEKRLSYCELTVQYWAWKNVKADYYGLGQYRRYLSFARDRELEDDSKNIPETFIDNDAKKHYGLNSDCVSSRIEGYDIVVSDPVYVNEFPEGTNSVISQYDVCNTMHSDDLLKALEIIRKYYPEYAEDAEAYFNGNILYMCNMFIMKQAIFDDYCKWIFAILGYLESEIDTSRYCIDEMRAVGMVGERLLGVYLMHRKRIYPEEKWLTLQRVFFKNPENLHLPKPYYSDNGVAIAFVCSDYFAPYMGVTIRSLLENANTKFNYDIFVLNTSIGESMKEKLTWEISAFKNAHIRFFDVTPWVKNGKFDVTLSPHVAVETFYCLLIPTILKNFQKVIYLDSDLIVLDDISKLWMLPIGNCLLAATHDPDFVGEYNGAAPGIDKYAEEVLKLQNAFNYFQTGILVFNVEKFRSCFEEGELFDFAQTMTFRYLDQDVLNVKCEGRVFYLEQRWNVLHDCEHFRVNYMIKRAPVALYDGYMMARQNPAIIHYAGREKPWESTQCDFAECFWLYARRSVFYEALIYRLTSRVVSNAARSCPCLQLLARPPAQSRARDLADRLLPKGSRQREFLKKLMPRESQVWNLCKKIYYFLGGK